MQQQDGFTLAAGPDLIAIALGCQCLEASRAQAIRDRLGYHDSLVKGRGRVHVI